MTKAIIFDLWGTLVETGIRSPLKQAQSILGIELPFSEYVVRMERALMTRKFTGLREAFQAVSAEFSLAEDEDTLDRLVGMWNSSWMLAQPYVEVKSALTKLRQNHTLILVSNTDEFSAPRVLEKFQLNELFEKMFFSFEVGLLKTDPDFFTEVLHQTNLTATEVVMVGDSMESDILPAQRAGIRAILVDRRSRRDFSPKINNLHQLSALL